jgi:hypothetical protein
MTYQQNTIAVVFDFDDTLAPDSTSGFLAKIGVDVKSFWGQTVEQLVSSDWDPIPAYLYAMIDYSRSTRPICRDDLLAWGRDLPLYDQVDSVFSLIRQRVAEVSDHIDVEFYIISSGIGDVIRSSRIAHEFADIWASEFHYNEHGEICFARKIVSFTDKTRYLFQISKGLTGNDSRGRPFDVNRKVAPEHLKIPFDQFIVVGDGYTDIPCFSMIRKNGGYAIGIFDPEDRRKSGKAWGYFIDDDRTSNMAPADYSPRSALTHSLLMAVESKARNIALRKQTYQG